MEQSQHSFWDLCSSTLSAVFAFLWFTLAGATHQARLETSQPVQIHRLIHLLHIRKKDSHPFEDDTLLVCGLESRTADLLLQEKYSDKFDASLFAFAANNKKRPNSMILGSWLPG